MSTRDALRAANVRRVLVVDDDLDVAVSLQDLDATGARPRPAEVLEDSGHEDTEALDALLGSRGIAHGTASERAAALGDDAVRALAPAFFRDAYASALGRRTRANAPLKLLLGWLNNEFGVEVSTWSCPKDLEATERYDLVIVDYYLVDERFDATGALINEIRTAHKDADQPLLVVLMSSNTDQLRDEFQNIRDSCGMSATQFRILAKPGNPERSEAIEKEKWSRALSTLANERSLVRVIEAFATAWGESLGRAAATVSNRLRDLDASAIGMLIETAKQDSMSFEEYVSDVIARRISAEAESNSFPRIETRNVVAAIGAANLNLALDQGVEVRHGQRAVRALMSDVLWHRPEWWRPPEPPPTVPPAVADDAESERAAVITQNQRYAWMKRFLRFGTVLRSGSGELLLNLTQACDVQSVRFEKADQVNFLFLRGEKFSIDKVAEGEKAYDSSFYCDDLQSDQFYTLQWHMRRPSTPSMREMFDHLNDYEVIGQLRMDAAYAVLAKFVSQTTRVALVRLPALYECSVELFLRAAPGQDWVSVPIEEVSATIWQRKDRDWRAQFSVDSRAALLAKMDQLQGVERERVASSLIASVKVESKERGEYHAQQLGDGGALLVRMDGRATYEVARAKKYFSSQNSYVGRYCVLLRGAPLVD